MYAHGGHGHARPGRGGPSRAGGTVGHKSTHVTEAVYRHVIVPAIQGGATVMDSISEEEEDD